MPTPEIQEASVQQEATPVVSQQTPGVGSYAGATVGQALDVAGDALWKIGTQEYQRAMQAKAQQAESNAQREMQQVRDGYASKQFGENAVKTHQQTSDALEAIRTKYEHSIPSKMGRNVYNNATLKILRMSQEGVDSHFERQNKVFQNDQFLSVAQNNTKEIATQARDNPANALKLLRDLPARARQQAEGQGKEGEAADAFVSKIMQAPTQAYLVGLTHNLDVTPTQLDEAYEKYGTVLTDAGRKSVEAAIFKKSVAWTASAIVDTLPVVAYDARGRYNVDAVQEHKANLDPDDPRTPAIIKSLDHAVLERNNEVKARVLQSMDAINKAQVRGQPFKMSLADSADVAEIRMNDGALARALDRRETNELATAQGRELRTVKTANRASFNEELFRVNTLSDDALRQLNPKEYANVVRALGLPEPMVDKLTHHVEAEQKEATGGLTRTDLTSIASAVATAAHRGSPRLSAQAKLEIHSALAEAKRNGLIKDYDSAVKFAQSKTKIVPNGTTMFGLVGKTATQWQIDAAHRDSDGPRTAPAQAVPVAKQNVPKRLSAPKTIGGETRVYDYDLKAWVKP